MVRYPESRFERRLAKRKEAQERLAEKMGRQEPRSGDDRRRVERRAMVMSKEEVEDWLKRNGISGGDRRSGNRRQGDRRR
jgi:hypothetical protein